MDVRKMNDARFASLTYKELQALASKYSVPGNIKKHLLVQILQAVEKGNLGEVKKVLKELQQNRKKRVRKTKNDKLANVTSTPAHSPAYHEDEGREYYSQPTQSYQWVAPDTEISLREEDQNRVPSYEEFHKFLVHRMCTYGPFEHRTQQYYYDNSSNERSESPSIVDLRVSTEKSEQSIIQSLPIELTNTKSTIIATNSEIITGNSSTCRIVDVTGNIQSPMLLKKMLQAPVGTNLKDLATVDGVYTILSTKNKIDDSDTETAESENNENNDDDPVTWENNEENYYCLVNENNSQTPQDNLDPLSTINNQNILDNSIQDVNNRIDQVENHYNYNNHNNNYESGNEQFKNTTWQNSTNERNCQKWLMNSTNINNNKDTQFSDQNNGNRIIHSMYNSNNQINIVNNNNSQNFTTFPENYQFQGQVNNNNNNHEKNRTHKNQNDYVNSCYQNFDGNYHSQLKIDGNFGNLYNPTRPEMNLEQFYHQMSATNQNIPNFHGIYPINSQENNGMSLNNFRIPENPWGQFNNRYPGYNINGNGCGNSYNHSNDNHSGGYYQQNVSMEYNIHENRGMELESQQNPMQNEKINSSLQTMKPTEYDHSTSLDGVLDSFRPRWTASDSDSTSTSNSSGHYLENTLNLRKYNSIDRSKIDETSCVYCYTGPIVSPISQTSMSSSSRKKEYIAESRKQSFSSYFMIYEDSSTGLRMANLDYLNINLESVEQRTNQEDEEINSSQLNTYFKFMDKNCSMETSDSEEIINNDVWINQNANFHNPMSNSG